MKEERMLYETFSLYLYRMFINDSINN
ncbi:hypothetical protein PT2222_180196 [Paraburkholderia tropica]